MSKEVRESFRLSEEEQRLLNDATKKSKYKKSEIIRIGMIKEAKKILRDIERDKR